MKTTNPLDAARIDLLLSELRLPAIKLTWAKLAEQSDKEGWPAARFLAALAEHEIAKRNRRRSERRLAQGELRLPVRSRHATVRARSHRARDYEEGRECRSGAARRGPCDLLQNVAGSRCIQASPRESGSGRRLSSCAGIDRETSPAPDR